MPHNHTKASTIVFSKRYPFADWPNREIPLVAAGVYAIWHNDTLIYCGMSGREISKAQTAGKTRYGLTTRLASHASGRLSGDQFCVYVANRLIIPSLTPDDLPKFASGEYRLDYKTKDFIHDHLEYQYVVVETSVEAYRIENEGRGGKLFEQKPLLNPLAD
jgi:hypothetical protein